MHTIPLGSVTEPQLPSDSSRRRNAIIAASLLRGPEDYLRALADGHTADQALVYVRRGDELIPVGSSAGQPPEPARRAADAGAPVVAGRTTWLAAWCRESLIGPPIGLVVLRFDRMQPPGVDAVAEFALLASRLAVELTTLAAYQRMEAENERLRAGALIDALTGTWNRSVFERVTEVEIAAARRRGESLGVVVLDVDQLARVNSRFGHAVGDALLRHITAIIRANVRINDEVGRIGDDEIALLLMNVDVDRAYLVAEKLIRRINATPLVVDGTTVEYSVRAGVTVVEASEVVGDAAFARAVGACNRARDEQSKVEASISATFEIVGIDEDAQVGSLVGATLEGMYRVIHEINRGSSGVVYRGEDLGLSRPVAIKVLRHDQAFDATRIERFQREASILASLRHPNLVEVHAFRATEEEVYFVMELVEGPTVASLLEDHQRNGASLDIEAVAEVIGEVGDALEVMHGAGLVHGDVKPLNIVLDRKGERAVLVDVGESRRPDDERPRNGTPGFAAPESFSPSPESPAVDVYALAATAYAMLTGSTPYGAGDALTLLARQLDGPPPPPSSLRPDLGPAVDTVLLKALASEPKLRFGSPSAFALALRSALLAARGAAPARADRAARAGQLRALTIDLNPGTTEPSDRARAMVRGAAFRVAAKVLSARVGEPWLRRLAQARPDLAPLLAPSLPAMWWFPLDQLIELVTSAESDDEEILRSVGRGMVSVTFSHVYGADYTSLSPLGLLTAVPSLWSRYFAFGNASLIATGDRTVVLAVGEPPGAKELVAGFLARVAEITGVAGVNVSAGPCCNGHREFTVSWEEDPARG